MDYEPSFHNLGDCQRVDNILAGQLVIESENLLSFFLWRARWHASTCDSCQQKHPGVGASLAEMIVRAEMVLALEIDEIRGEHIREASGIARRSILSRAADSIFPLDEVVATTPLDSTEKPMAVQEDTTLLLMKALANAGQRVKQVFAAVHGEGLVWFNVIPDLANDEQEHARKECAGLIRQLSAETREFAFSAALAAELFPNLAWSPDTNPPKNVDWGVLYKVVVTAAREYVDAYLQDPAPQSLHLAVQRRPGETEFLQSGRPQTETDADKLHSVYEAQTVMMQVQSDLMAAHSELMERIRGSEERDKARDSGKGPGSIDAECEATWRKALGSRFTDLAEETRDFLLSGERSYTHPRNEMDFTSTVLFLTKAFEFEFRKRVIVPLIDDLDPVVRGDSTFKTALSKFTLGQCLGLFNKHALKVTILLDERLGLKFQRVCEAIGRVNIQKDVKHSARKTEAQAKSFRDAFLGKESVLSALSPSS